MLWMLQKALTALESRLYVLTIQLLTLILQKCATSESHTTSFRLNSIRLQENAMNWYIGIKTLAIVAFVARKCRWILSFQSVVQSVGKLCGRNLQQLSLLLVHARNFKTDFYGCIAGFVETGESLEEAVRREVMEETHIRIKNLKYFKSQPWPYPCGLMVGFFAEYESGELVLQESELSKGGWFNKNNLPTIPEKLSLARMLIDCWLGEHRDK